MRRVLLGCLSVLLSLLPSLAHALPSYARQTGEACVACHVSFPELTPYGRLFKLSGYTLGTAQRVPLAAMMEASLTRINTQGNDIAYPRQNEGVLEGGSLFVAGKLGEHAGMFSQWTYSDLNGTPQADGSFHMYGHSSVDNNDWRLVDHIAKVDLDLIYGLSLNNNPTVQDAWNSTPAFAYPFQSSRIAGVWGVAAPATLIEGGLAQQVAGLSAYGFLNKHWYAELGDYRYAASGPLTFLRVGATVGNRLVGNNPYWRLLYSRDWDEHALSLGLFGLNAKVSLDPDSDSAGSDRHRDTGVDVQYQWLSDPHIVTTQAYWVHERTDWDSSHVGNDKQYASSTLNAFHWKGSYWYQRKYGLTLGYFAQHGSDDALANLNGTPDTRGYITEFNYMITPAWRLGLQYTGYWKYQGASDNYDGNGRNARNNNTTYLYTWIAF